MQAIAGCAGTSSPLMRERYIRTLILRNRWKIGSRDCPPDLILLYKVYLMKCSKLDFDVDEETA